jgi:hypothetical protein
MCPLCHSTNVRRSYPKLWEFLILIFLGRPSRCMDCDKRFYRWPWTLSRLPSRPPEAPPVLTAFKPPRRKSAAAAAAVGKR